MSPPSGEWRLWAVLFRLGLRLHPGGERRRYAREAVEAFVGGVRRRLEERGSSEARRYAARAVWDVWTAGWRVRRRSGSEGGGEEGLLGVVGQDLRHAFRRLVRAPGFTSAVVLILALGVGANAAVFTVLKSAVLAPLPFPHADRLVLPRWTTTAPGVADTIFGQWSYPKFAEFREGSTGVFDLFAGYARRSTTITDPGDAESVGFEWVTAGYFELVGATPAVGRFFTAEEEGTDAAPGVVVLSHSFWVERFGADPTAVGRTVTADGARLEIVGVAEEGFEGLTGGARLWIPLGQVREAYGSWATDGRLMHWFHALGRLHPGLSPGVAEERVAALAEEIDAVEPQLVDGERIGMSLAPLGAVGSNRNARTSVWLAMAAALLVLAIAVANVAALLIARGRREARETAVRLALGAGKGRLVRERLTEALVLSAVGGGIGLAAAAWGMAGLRAAIPTYLFRGSGGGILLVGDGAFGVDAGAALFGLAAALLAGAVFGVAPTLAQGAVDLVPALRQGGRRAVVRSDRSRLLVGGQVALSVVLLVGAGLMLGTLRRQHEKQTGFDAEGLLVLRYSLGGPDGGYGMEAAREFHRTFRDRLRSLPGVRTVGMGSTPPLSGHFVMTHVRGVVGREPYPEGSRPRIGVHVAGVDFFTAAGTRVLEGRTFTPGEAEQTESVTVLSRRAAEELFPGESPIGREVEMALSLADGSYPYRVVGVVEDVLYSSPVEGLMAEAYIPTGLWAPPVMAALVRTDGEPIALVPEARRILRALDPDVPFWQIKTGRELRGEDVADTRLLFAVLGVFAALAVVLSTAGLWAVVARAVAERRREIGLRVALGARTSAVEALVFRQGLGPVLGGAAVGLLLAGVLTPRLDAILFGVTPRSPVVFAGATALLVAVALLATWLPARRAARVEPREALAGD